MFLSVPLGMELVEVEVDWMDDELEAEDDDEVITGEDVDEIAVLVEEIVEETDTLEVKDSVDDTDTLLEVVDETTIDEEVVGTAPC